LYESGSSGNNYVITTPKPIVIQPTNTPTNAYISGSNWYCNNGYKTIYNGTQKVGCEKVIAPTNAYVSGSNWYCSSGYVRSGQTCVSK